MAQFGFKVALPIMGVSDIVHRELTITKNGEEPPEVKVYDKVTLTDELVYDAGDSLVFVLVDIDSAGNRSPQSAAFVYEVTDTIPPPQPGNLGVVELRQIG